MKRLCAVLLCLTAVAVLCCPSLAEELITVYTNENGGSVQSGPLNPTLFTADQEYHVRSITTYHYAGMDRQAAPGTISLVRTADNALLGSWDAKGSPGQGGVPDAFWTVYPEIVLERGVQYQVLDSSPETWSHNMESNYCGFVNIRGVLYKRSTIMDLFPDSLTGTGGIPAVTQVPAATAVPSGTGTGSPSDIVAIAAGWYYSIGLRRDGTVIAAGNNDRGQCDVGGWSDVVFVAGGRRHSAAVRKDGTVVAIGDNSDGRCDVGGWTDIVAVACNEFSTVGLRKDGTLVTAGYCTGDGECDVGAWNGAVAVYACNTRTAALRKDGMVLSAGAASHGSDNTSEWSGIIALAVTTDRSVGVREDGTVLVLGYGRDGALDVNGWTDIVDVKAGSRHTVGLRRDGTVVAAGSNDLGQCDVGSWTDVVAIAAGKEHTVGLKRDGTLLAAGRNSEGQCDVGGWTSAAASPYLPPVPDEETEALPSSGPQGTWTGTAAYQKAKNLDQADVPADGKKQFESMVGKASYFQAVFKDGSMTLVGTDTGGRTGEMGTFPQFSFDQGVVSASALQGKASYEFKGAVVQEGGRGVMTGTYAFSGPAPNGVTVTFIMDFVLQKD